MSNRAEAEFLVYEPGVEVPRDVTHVFVHPSVKVLPEAVFLHLRHLKEVVLPEGLREIGPAAFRACRSLERVSFPSTLLRIDDCGFSLCTSLTTLHFREGLTEIGERAFIHCNLLKHLSLSFTVTTICPYAFMHCSSLEVLILVEGIQTIGSHAFYECALEDIVLPATLIRIDSRAFGSCPSLKMVKLCGGIQLIRVNAFAGCNLLNLIRVTSKCLVFTLYEDGVSYETEFTTDGTIVELITRSGSEKVVITSECFYSMRAAEVSTLETHIIEILRMQFEDLSDKHERLRELVAVHERRRKEEVASLLKLGVRKAEMCRAVEMGPGIREERHLTCKADVIVGNVVAFL